MKTQTEYAIPVFQPDPEAPQNLLRVCPVYRATPLLEIPGQSDHPIFVKDERDRMGLGAFKALGGVYAVARLIAEHCQEAIGRALEPEDFLTPEVQALAGSITFVCASAGNHGLAVAAGARTFGATARIHLAGTVPESFADRLRSMNATVVRSGEVYEDALAAANADADTTGAVLLADGSWPGYTHPPALVMEGYTVIAEELRTAFDESRLWPTHVYLQAGVGGLAAAVAHMIRLNWPVQPEIIIVEPEAAPCLRESHRAGRPVRADGPVSSMGRLDCKEPSIIAHAVLERCNVGYVTVSEDDVAAACAYLDGAGLATTPSGAAGYAAMERHGKSAGTHTPFRPLVFFTEAA